MSVRRAKFLEVVKAAVQRRGVALMGVCNVTPDSFSDGGAFLGQGAAKERIEAMIAEGADIVDIGAESTLAQAARVDDAGQNSKLLPVIQALRAADILVSVETYQADVNCVLLV